MTLAERAAQFAAQAHAGQTRKGSGLPYFTHCEAVANAVREAGGTEEMVAAAFLHDTLEDTPVTMETLVTEFGPTVAELVKELTDVFTPSAFPQFNRRARKQLECARLAHVSPAAKQIKLADIADNASSIEMLDPAFAKVWLVEKAALLAVLR